MARSDTPSEHGAADGGRCPPYFLGVEIGGTKLQAALGDGLGRLDRKLRAAANAAAGHHAICEQIVRLVAELHAVANDSGQNIERIGVGFGGPVDPESGLVLKSHQVEGWDNFPIVNWLEERAGIPVVLGNDSDLAGLAEARFGAGKGMPRVVYMNIGSGIGGAIVLNGQVYTSQGAGASEIGHLRIRPDENGTHWQTLEEICSGWAIARLAERLSDDVPADVVARWTAPTHGEFTAQTFFAALQEGRESFQQAFQTEILQPLGIAMANVITLFRPEIFVIGGGVSLVGEMLFTPLRQEVDRHVFAPYRGSYQIVLALLGEDVVLHGAVALARNTGKSC